MATAFRKMGVYLGLVEDDDYADVETYGAVAHDQPYAQPQHSGRREPENRREVDPRRALDNRTDVPAGRSTAYESYPAESAEFDEPDADYEPPRARITTLHPRTYNEAKTIGLQFRGGTPVIMNLSEMDDADAKRLVDFAAGLTFGLYGSLERVTPKVFLLSPKNITVTAADKARIAEGGFYNQS